MRPSAENNAVGSKLISASGMARTARSLSPHLKKGLARDVEQIHHLPK